MDDVFIVGACRTPIGKFGGSLSGVPAPELGAVAIAGALARSGVDAGCVDEVVMGNVLQAGLGQGPARQAAIKAGLGVSTPAFSVNEVCGSGLLAASIASSRIRSGEARAAVAGGMENMSAAPFALAKARWGYRLGDGALKDIAQGDGLTDAFGDYPMGVTAENVAEKCAVSRGEQDEFALASQGKAAAAIAAGRFRDEIVDVEIEEKKGKRVVSEDEHPRPGVTLADLAALRPCFKEGGTVTAGNSSGLNDGAAALVLASGARARELGLSPLARVVACANAGVEPSLMGLGPVAASRAALARCGLRVEDMDLIEANEAFAAQAVAVGRELGWESSRVNVNGGAIALGHPIGASGARILVTLVYELARRRGRYGLATLCVGGGMGVAMVIERL
jgi:acetyl-CoA C-acetyltransferase